MSSKVSSSVSIPTVSSTCGISFDGHNETHSLNNSLKLHSTTHNIMAFLTVYNDIYV